MVSAVIKLMEGLRNAFSVNGAVVLEVCLRTCIIYCVLVFGVRLSGKRQIAQLTPFDLVVLLLLSNAVQNAMTGPDTTIIGGLTAAATLLILNMIVARLRYRFPEFRHAVEGVSIDLVLNGEVQTHAMQHEQMTQEELMAALGSHEVDDIHQVKRATLEVDGSITVIRQDPQNPSRLIHSRRKLARHTKRPNQ